MELHTRRGKISRVLVFVFSLIFVGLILHSVNAGSLTPTAAPAGTFHTLREIFNPLASTSYDASAIASNSNGSALGITKCIIYRIHGGSC